MAKNIYNESDMYTKNVKIESCGVNGINCSRSCAAPDTNFNRPIFKRQFLSEGPLAIRQRKVSALTDLLHTTGSPRKSSKKVTIVY